MNRNGWLAVLVSSGVGAWLWSRRRRGQMSAAPSRGTVIFDNTPRASGADLSTDLGV